MAATIQTTPAQQQANKANPQLKRIVYSKYRELLGSYNDKANAIIDSLPAYMVKEDRGFHFDPKIIDEVDKVVYGTPPAPPPISAGSIPAQRLSTQTPQYNVGEAPACVQNAMMTKDKKPFTYTPGGIDLSQIKSPRMAQRLARNAQSEGATGQQQMNRPQSQSNGGSSPAAQLGATAMGMPFQVLPTGPPPPPPQPNKAGPPPPPPPSSQVKLAPQANGNATRKSPTPQNFEPPPMGFRPEIKIPPNPMAALKKVPPPQEKNNFWVEEYRKERSKSPMVGNDENDYNRSPPNNQQPETNQYTSNNYNQLPRQQNEYQLQQRSPSPQPMRPQPDRYSQADVSPPRTPVQQYVQEQPRRTETPNQVQYSPQPQPQQQPQQQQFPAIQRQFSNNQPQYQPPQSPLNSPQQQQSPPIQRQQQFNPPQQYQGPTSPQYQPPQQQSPQQQQQTVPWRTQRSVPQNAIQNNVSRPRDVMSPAPSESPRPQPQQQYPAYLRSRDMLSPAPESQPLQASQPYQQKNAQVGSIYIPPVTTQQQQQQQQQQQLRQAPANRWGSNQTSPVDTQTLNRLKSPPPPSSNGFSSSNNTGLKLQINNNTSGSTGKERIIPIQLEQTPTPTRTPSAPGFGPQPYYNTNQQQYNSVPSPPLGQTSNGQTPPGYVIRSPNQFVDQGYNNYPGSQDPNRVTSPARIIQQTNNGLKERVIPIAVDTQPDGPLNPNNVRGPISKQPLVIQNDPRNQNQNAWGSGNTTPNQSRSFRILQKITDTAEDAASDSKAIESDGGDPEPQLQRPTYARQMGPGQLTSPTIEQMKRMQLNNDQAFVNRTKNPENDVDESVTVKADNVDPRYRGPTNPSITFKKLQGAIERCSPSRTDRDGTPPVMKQPQPNRYVNQRPAYSPEEQTQQYVHPSEQQVPEPKKYTGSAIPSRSFKILQAMTTPENAAEMEGSDVVEENKSITECPCQRPPRPFSYPYPYLPPCCHQPSLSPSSSVSDDLCNWQYPPHPSHMPHYPHYPYHPHHHPHSHPHQHQHQHHPYPPCPCYYYYHPSNEYDSQNCSQCQTHDSFRRSKSMSQELPNIIITPSAEDIRASQPVRDTKLGRDEREGSVIENLSRMLNEIAKPPQNDSVVGHVDQSAQDPQLIKPQKQENKLDGAVTLPSQMNLASSEKKGNQANSPINQVKTKDAVNSEIKTSKRPESKASLFSMPSLTNLSNPTSQTKKESKMVQKENIVEKPVEDDQMESDDSSSDDLLTSSSDQSSTTSYEDCAEQIPNNGLQSIKSVTNIQVYQKKVLSAMDTYDEDRTGAEGESMIFDNEEEEEGEFEAEELEYDEEEGQVEEMVSEGDEDEMRELEEDDDEEVIIMDNLSVIYEENEADAMSPRPSSRVSSSVSDSSTLANEEGDADEQGEELQKDEDEDENSNSVTVRLPLKFSFSRSSNDENITTVEVGSSQIQEQRRSFSIASIKADSEDEEESDLDDCDVSVTVSLSPSSGSIDRKSSFSPAPQKVESAVVVDDNKHVDYDSDSENVSVSFSLPMRNKFMNQTWNGDLTNNIAMDEDKTLDKPLEKSQKEQLIKSEEKDVWASTEVIQAAIETRRRNSQLLESKEQMPIRSLNGQSMEVEKNPLETRRRNSRVLEDKNENITDPSEIKKKKIVEDIEKLSKSLLREESKENADNDLDFWATLQATRKEAQLLLEKTANYWGQKTNQRKKDETIVASENQLQSDEDFWANIRVKDVPKSSERAPQPTEKTEATEDETKPKATKPKKKKKIIKPAEKKTEPKHELTTINLPNAKNRAKIVESTIKMIQDKVQKPKDLIKKEIKNEVEVSDFVANIKVAYDKEHAPVKPPLSRKFSRSLGSEDAPDKDDKAYDNVSKQSEERNEIKEEPKIKLQKETIKLLTNVFEKKFAKTSGPIDKPLVQRAALSEIQPKVDTTTQISLKNFAEDIQIAIENIENTPVSQKLANSAKVTEDIQDATLKPPKPKMMKKPKKIHEDQEIENASKKGSGKPALIILNEEVQREEGPASVIVEIVDESQTFVKEVEVINEYEMSPDVSQEIDFWATIQPSDSESYIETKTVTTDGMHHDQHDFWAEIKSSEDTQPEEPVKPTLPENENASPKSPEVDFWSEIDSFKSKKEDVEVDFWAEIEASKTSSASQIEETPIVVTNTLDVPEIQKIDTVVDPPVVKTKSSEASGIKKSKSKVVKKSKSTDIGTEGEPTKPKTKKKISKTDDTSVEKELKSKPKKKQSISNDDSTDFWAQIEAAAQPTKKASIRSTLHIYSDADIELVNLIQPPRFYASYTQVELHSGYWASIGYIEKEEDINNLENEAELKSEVDTGKIDFWVTQRKFETNSGFDKEATPTQQEETEEVDFWAEIKGEKEEDVLPPVATKDVCEVRRNNYKKAMAFFTNTVSIEKKDDSVTLSKNIAEVEKNDTIEVESSSFENGSWDWKKENIENVPTTVAHEEMPPENKSLNSWNWRNSVEHEWEAPDEREVSDVFLIVEDHEPEDEPDTLIEKSPYEMDDGSNDHASAVEEAPSESSESIDDSTPNHFEVQHQYPKPEPAPIKPKEQPLEPPIANKFSDEIKISVKDRIFAFETGTVEQPAAKNLSKTSLNVDSATPKSNLSRNSSQRSESEIEEDDSGVTDMKLLSETDTESESFPELRKMSRYQRASTHSRLFKLLQDENDIIEEEKPVEVSAPEEELNFKPRKKIVHNVSITRKQNPNNLRDAESMAQRRERLSLPLRKNASIDADNPSSPNSPASPIFGQPAQTVSDKLVNELVQSLLLKKSSSAIKNLPMEKLQAAAKRALEEEMDSLENTSLDSTPALTPQEFKSESYSDYYDSWNAKNSSDSPLNSSFEILPSKAFKNLQDTTSSAKRRPWSVRCPRVLSSKTVNRDLARVTESPEIYSRKSNSPDISFSSDRACSVGRWRKVLRELLFTFQSLGLKNNLFAHIKGPGQSDL